jgi:adenylosuccinate synthase
MRLLIVLSGPIGVGKSSFASELEKLFDVRRVSTRRWLIENAGAENERGSLLAAGERMDRETGGGWVAEAAAAGAANVPEDAVLLIDSARIAPQVENLRSRFSGCVFHVHLHAADETLEHRYLNRPAEMKEFATYAELRLNGTEAAVGELAATADLVLDADHADPRTLAVTAMAFHGQVPPEIKPLVDVIVGGQYGSEGKGNVVAHLARGYGALMRGGAKCGTPRRRTVLQICAASLRHWFESGRQDLDWRRLHAVAAPVDARDHGVGSRTG